MTATHHDTEPTIGEPGAPTPEGVDPGAELPAPPPSKSRRLADAYRRLPVWAGPVAAGGLALSGCIYIGLVDPNQPGNGAYPQCAFKMLTGLDCPGCGLTRGVHALVTGHPLRALDHNVLLALIVPIAVYSYAVWLTRSVFGWNLPAITVPKKLSVALLPILLGFWVLRNIPVGPLTWLGSGAAGV